MNEEKLLRELERCRDEYSKEINQLPNNLSFSEFRRLSEKASIKVLEASRSYRKIKTPNYINTISEFGDVMTIKDFIANCECGNLIDSDGYGVYIKDGKETDIEICPSDVEYNVIRGDFTEMIWFNK